MFKKFFDCSISGILLAIGLGVYLTALIMFDLSNVSVFCFFTSPLCFGMGFYIVESIILTEQKQTDFKTVCIVTLLIITLLIISVTISVTLLMIGVELRSSI